MDAAEKMVEIARFTYVTDARVLVSLLKSEGIDCYIQNEYMTQILSGLVDIGGARVEVLESTVQQALLIMKEHGNEIPGENEHPSEIQTVSGWARHIPFLRKLPLEKQIFFFLLLLAVLLALLVYASKLLS